MKNTIKLKNFTKFLTIIITILFSFLFLSLSPIYGDSSIEREIPTTTIEESSSTSSPVGSSTSTSIEGGEASTTSSQDSDSSSTETSLDSSTSSEQSSSSESSSSSSVPINDSTSNSRPDDSVGSQDDSLDLSDKKSDDFENSKILIIWIFILAFLLLFSIIAIVFILLNPPKRSIKARKKGYKIFPESSATITIEELKAVKKEKIQDGVRVKYCSNCGFIVDDAYVFCSQCGAKLK